MKRQFDLARIWFIASCVVILFGYGVAVGRYQIFPFRILDFGVSSFFQLRDEARVIAGVLPSWHLLPARHEGDGVTIARTDRMSPGLTLLAGMFGTENQLRLVQPDGTPVRVWPVSYIEIFSDAEAPQSAYTPQRDWNTQIHGALALPDGSVVFNFDYAGTVKLDRCGAVEWILPRTTHHSVEPSQEGGFWIPDRVQSNKVAGFPWSEAVYVEDLILHVSESGEVLEEKHIAEVFLENGLLHLLLLKGPGTVFRSDEIVHLNDIEELPDSVAYRFPAFEGGDLLLSFRNEHLLMVVDPDDWRVKWYQMGPWIMQHDPDFQPDGTITIFNNKKDDTADGTHLGGSEIMALDPGSGHTWAMYGGVPVQEMHSEILGKHQVLPNGNILVTQAQSGRLLEVTEAGEVVWEMINRHDGEQIAVVTQATRYPPSYFRLSDWACP